MISTGSGRAAARRRGPVWADGVDGFLTSLRSEGLLVRLRYSERDPGQLTGYAAVKRRRSTAGRCTKSDREESTIRRPQEVGGGVRRFRQRRINRGSYLGWHGSCSFLL